MNFQFRQAKLVTSKAALICCS